MGTCVKHMGGIIVALLVSSVVRVSVACAQTSYVDRMDWLLGDVFEAECMVPLGNRSVS